MSLRARAISIGLLSLFMVFLVFPSFVDPKVREASGWIPDQAIELGLDLQGGTHWLMRIDSDTAVEQRLRQALSSLQVTEEEEGVNLGTAEIVESERAVRICGADPRALEETVEERFELFELREPQDGCRDMVLSESGLDYVLSLGVDQSIEVLQSRLTEGGLKEPIIAKQGEDRILVQLPGSNFQERSAALQIISVPARLEFKKVLDVAPNEGLLEANYPGGLPEDTRIAVETQDENVVAAYLVPDEPVVTGDLLEDARPEFDNRTQQPVVSFVWNSEGTVRFREFTGENVGERMAIIKDDNVISAPVIQSRIGKYGQISGSFTTDSANTLAVQLRAGALPIPLIIEEERSVGPSLGEDSIRAGIWSIAVGGIFVVIFMLVYYQTSGLLADLALILNLVIVLAVMGSFEATLTLPGIAGLVLTVGMAVDANVIIFERIREELRGGRPLRSAVQIGFNRSSLTIFDANVTTLLAAIVLYYVGRGPVQGFGVTLIIGIFSSVFCALVVTRLLIDLLLARGVQKLRI